MSLTEKLVVSLIVLIVFIIIYFVIQEGNAEQERFLHAPCTSFLNEELRYTPTRCLKELSK